MTAEEEAGPEFSEGAWFFFFTCAFTTCYPADLKEDNEELHDHTNEDDKCARGQNTASQEVSIGRECVCPCVCGYN